MFNLLSVNAFNLVMSKNLLCGKGLIWIAYICLLVGLSEYQQIDEPFPMQNVELNLLTHYQTTKF